MSVFADAYSRYLSYNFNCINKQRELRKYFLNGIIYITAPKFLSEHLLDNYETFPKYPFFFKAFVRTDAINLVKIYNSSMDNVNYLLDGLCGSDELLKKPLYDSIPHVNDLFLSELNFQFSYISTSTDFFNYNYVIQSFVNEIQYRNFFSDLYSSLFYSASQEPGETAELEKHSFLLQYFFYAILFNVLSSITNIPSKLYYYSQYVNDMLPNNDKVNSNRLITSFSNFIDNYKSVISLDLTTVIGKGIYNYENISQKLLLEFESVILNNICDVDNGIVKCFETFMNQNTYLEPCNFLNNYFYQMLISLTSIDCICEIFKTENIINVDQIINYDEFENSEYADYMSKITEFTLKKYLFLGFLYKFWPIKFLNVLQLTIKEFIENEIKTPDDEVMSKTEFSNSFNQFCEDGINYTNLANLLNTHLLPSEELITYGIDTPATFTFTPNSSTVYCSNIESFNSINIHDFIYASSNSRSSAKYIVYKDLETLSFNLNDEYVGDETLVDVTAYKYDFNSEDNYFKHIIDKFDVCNFVGITYYIQLFDSFFNSTEYNTFVEQLSFSIFTFLRDSGHVDYSFNWYKYHDIINVYLKIFFRWKLLDPSVRCVTSNKQNSSFQFTKNSSTIKCNNKKSYDSIDVNDYIFSEKDNLEVASQVISKEKIGTEYFLNISPNYSGSTTTTGYEIAYKYQSLDNILFKDFTYNFEHNIIEPILTNTTYDPIYDSNIMFLEDDVLLNKIMLFSNSSSFINGMYRFSENMVLSSVTKETIYAIISDFIV
ncbi:MAG: hypothetical protein PHD05_00855 [Sphaerochaetaceae bacterium]|nr:hypothetical protein [Sphaerochaetaceae bacterium]